MKYVKTGVAALLALGLAAPAASAHRVTAASAANLNTVVRYNSTYSNAPSFNWQNRVTVSGLLNTDFNYANHGWNTENDAAKGVMPSFDTSIPHATDLSIKTASLLFDAKINRFTQAHVGLIYMDVPGPFCGPEGDDRYAGVDEAYITLSDFAHEPFYMRAGREYTPFGNYNPYALTLSTTDLMSMNLASVLQVGYVAKNGFHGALYIANGGFSSVVSAGSTPNRDESMRLGNFGFRLGYSGRFRHMSYDANVDFVHDMRDMDYAAIASKNSGLSVDSADSRRAAGFAAHLNVRRGRYDFVADYVASLRNAYMNASFSPSDNGRLWSYALRGGYRFTTYGRASKVILGYQHTGEVVTAIPFPRYRAQVDYKVRLGRHTDVTVQYVYDKNYSGQDFNNPGASSNLFNVRLGVQF